MSTGYRKNPALAMGYGKYFPGKSLVIRQKKRACTVNASRSQIFSQGIASNFFLDPDFSLIDIYVDFFAIG